MTNNAKRYTTRKFSKFFLLFCILSGVISCSSSAPPLRYYLLHGVAPASGDSSAELNFQQTVVLNALVIPDYLKQAGLVYQLSPAELHISQSHFWSESVDVGINQLLRDGMKRSNIQLVSAARVPTNTDEFVSLSLFIDDFLPTWQGYVILKGRFELKDKSGEVSVHEFHYTQSLSEDGFDHSILAMRSVINSLSSDLSSSLKVN